MKADKFGREQDFREMAASLLQSTTHKLENKNRPFSVVNCHPQVSTNKGNLLRATRYSDMHMQEHWSDQLVG